MARADDGGYDVTVPDSPERQAAAFSVVLGSAMAGGYIGEVALQRPGYILKGAAAGAFAGVRLWNRWTGGA